jgi:hypothetical protein
VHVFVPRQKCAQVIVLYAHHHHFSFFCRQCDVDQKFECCDVRGGGCHFAGVIQPVTIPCESDPLFSIFVSLIVTQIFFICDLSVLGMFWSSIKKNCWFLECRGCLEKVGTSHFQTLFSKGAGGLGPS